MNLTEHFSLNEFMVSDSFPKEAARIIVDTQRIERLRFACASILEPVRRHFALPVFITSGVRTPELNRLIGGSEKSHHLFRNDHGACDFTLAADPQAIIRWMVSNVTFRCLIWYPEQNFYHVSFPDSTGYYNFVLIKKTEDQRIR